MEQRAANVAVHSSRRAWRDLSKLRLFLALSFAPVLPFAAGIALLLLIGTHPPVDLFGAVLAAADIWTLLIGSSFVVLARRYAVIHRVHCLLLGAFVGFTLPFAVLLTDLVLDGVPDTDPDLAMTEHIETIPQSLICLVFGLVLVPFGTVGGWVFWRVGVYPARPKVIDVGTVFD